MPIILMPIYMPVFLRTHAESLGVKRIEGKILEVETDHNSGHITQLTLADKSVVKGQLFIDCTGLHGLLLDKTLNVGFEDWSHWLPCDSALAVPCEHGEEQIKPYTRSIAHHAGWQWQIPLTNRIGNGLVYSQKHLSDDDAKALLLSNLPGKPLAEPRQIRFRTGRRLKQWHKNVVAIGLSSGFLEPLESTSIHLIQTAAVRLVKHFPLSGITDTVIDEYNRQSQIEFERIRDFIILHYKLTARDDSAFWRQCRDMEVPESLQHKINLFNENGLFFRQDDELFSEIAWQQVMLGQGAKPSQYHPLADALSAQQLADLMTSLKQLINHTSEQLPTHNEFLKNLVNK
jgi:tryptophan halogenase